MNAHFAERSGVRTFIHGGPSLSPRLLDLEVSGGEEIRIVLPLGSNVGASLLKVLEGRRFASAVGRIVCGNAAHLSYHRMISTNKPERPYDYGQPVILEGHVTFISGAITVGRDAQGAPLLHGHAGFLDSDGEQHGGHLVLDTLIVGDDPMTISLCLFNQVAYQVQPDAETHFNLLHPVLQEVS